MSVADIDTPALIVELAPFERNLKRMADFARNKQLRLRPHAKMHKTSAIAHRQIALGAAGACCQKTSEAEALVAGGIHDVLITNQVVGAPKLVRLARLGQHATIGVCVDTAANVYALSAAAKAAGALLHVYVEINVGTNRCGVEPGTDAAVLARVVASSPHLKLMGLQAYHGGAQHLRTAAERTAAITLAIGKAQHSRDLIRAAGLECAIITGAGTGTYEIEAASGVYNELQPGSYAFMDADYRRNQSDHPFEQSLFILTTVMSRSPGHAVVDCGLKAHSVDSGMALVAADAHGGVMTGLNYAKASDEHGVIVSSGGMLPALGDKLRLIPGHIDPTVNLHDWIIGIRGGVVEETWPVTARGAMW